MTLENVYIRNCMLYEFHLKNSTSASIDSENLSIQVFPLTETVFLMSDLVKIGLVDSGQETLISTTKTVQGDMCHAQIVENQYGKSTEYFLFSECKKQKK